MPKRFVGGPLRGPPPPKGWNFFIASSCAVAALAFERCYLVARRFAWLSGAATTVRGNQPTVPPTRNRSERKSTAVPLAYRSTATTHCCVCRRACGSSTAARRRSQMVFEADGSRDFFFTIMGFRPVVALPRTIARAGGRVLMCCLNREACISAFGDWSLLAAARASRKR